MLIKRVYEIDPLACPQCGGTMKEIAFIEPPQADVIEKILRHCGLWHCSRAPPGDDGFVREDAIWAKAHGLLDADGARRGSRDPVDDWYRQPSDDEPRELTFVDEETFWKEF